MQLSRRSMLISVAATAVGTAALAACTPSSNSSSSSPTSVAPATGELALDQGKWRHDSDNDVYYQMGVDYVTSPGTLENLGVFVPGAYLSATDNGDGTFTGSIKASGEVSGFTAATAPIVFPVNTPGYSAQNPPSEYNYDSISEFMKAGFVYVHAGLRGKDSSADGYDGNAPWGVTDLKAAVRYIRYNAGSIPGSPERMFVFGHSGGGAQSSVMGASGDSDLYTPYLESLGAVMKNDAGEAISDAVAGVMAWCPITSLNAANAAYEWNMGQFATTDTRAEGTWTKAYSTNLAEAYADYINELGLTDFDGKALELKKSDSGTYLAGSYYDHVMAVVTESLNNFLADTTFPYTPNTQEMAGMGGGGGTPPSGGAPSAGGTPPSGGSGSPGAGGSESAQSQTTYNSVDEYIAALNADTAWVTYDSKNSKATISSLEAFVVSQKSPSKDVGSMDSPDRSATENLVMGDNTATLHFSTISREVMAANEPRYASLTNWKDTYAASGYDADFENADDSNRTPVQREQMYDPVYYLAKSSEGKGSSKVAPKWRIRTGIAQGDTASTVEINLALALKAAGIEGVDFATVWGQGHTMAERSGDATTNFIDWVASAVG